MDGWMDVVSHATTRLVWVDEDDDDDGDDDVVIENSLVGEEKKFN